MNLFNILKRCKEAITSTSKKGKIIIIDTVINEEDEHDNTRAKVPFDILIMAHANGKKRQEGMKKSIL